MLTYTMYTAYLEQQKVVRGANKLNIIQELLLFVLGAAILDSQVRGRWGFFDLGGVEISN